MYDLNHDGKIDREERAVAYMVIEEMEKRSAGYGSSNDDGMLKNILLWGGMILLFFLALAS